MYTYNPKHIKSFLEKPSKKPKLIVLFGPTSSGKTNLSIKIAKDYNGEVISADSRQIYKHMDIGTGKVTEDEMQGVVHYMLDLIYPDQIYTVADYSASVHRLIPQIIENGKVPILCGGTGLYISSIIENYQLAPNTRPDKSFRLQLQKELEEKGKQYMFEKLKSLDPESAINIHVNNTRYIIRALEKLHLSGQSIEDKKGEIMYDYLLVLNKFDREELYKKINNRVLQMCEEGLVEEVKSLLTMGYSEKLPSMSSIGYSEFSAFLNGLISKEEAITSMQKKTRNYAKRQITWMSKMLKSLKEYNP